MNSTLVIPEKGKSTGRTPRHNFQSIPLNSYREYELTAEGAAHAYSRTNPKGIKLITRRTTNEQGQKKLRVYRIEWTQQQTEQEKKDRREAKQLTEPKPQAPKPQAKRIQPHQTTNRKEAPNHHKKKKNWKNKTAASKDSKQDRSEQKSNSKLKIESKRQNQKPKPIERPRPLKYEGSTNARP
mgnify:CR=1 FL=1